GCCRAGHWVNGWHFARILRCESSLWPAPDLSVTDRLSASPSGTPVTALLQPLARKRRCGVFALRASLLAPSVFRLCLAAEATRETGRPEHADGLANGPS